jgi:hypothetical protein
VTGSFVPDVGLRQITLVDKFGELLEMIENNKLQNITPIFVLDANMCVHF